MPHQKRLRMAACIAAFTSAAIHAGYFCVTHKLPVYAWDQCITFSIGLKQWSATGIAMALAGLGAAFLIASCVPKPRLYLSWLNFATCLFLLPATYTGCCIVMLFL